MVNRGRRGGDGAVGDYFVAFIGAIAVVLVYFVAASSASKSPVCYAALAK